MNAMSSESYNDISNKIKEMPSHDPRLKVIRFIINQKKSFELFNIKMEEYVVYLNKNSLSLLNKDKIYKIFEVFYQSPNYKIDRLTLIEKIYEQSKVIPISDRKKLCLNHNIVKLISRARHLAAKHLTNDELHVEWFPYDPVTRTWKFFRINDEKFEQLLLSA